MNIVVLEGYVNNPGDLSWDALKRYGNVTVYDRTPREKLAARVVDADVAVSSKIAWDAEALAWAPHLKMIALTSTGFNVVDLDAARERDIVVSNVPAYSTPDVAQMTFALLLELCLHVGKHSSLVMDGAWNGQYWTSRMSHRARVRHASGVREPLAQASAGRRRRAPSGPR